MLVYSSDIHVAGKIVGAVDSAGRVGGGDIFALFGDLCRNIITDTAKAKGV